MAVQDLVGDEPPSRPQLHAVVDDTRAVPDAPPRAADEGRPSRPWRSAALLVLGLLLVVGAFVVGERVSADDTAAPVAADTDVAPAGTGASASFCAAAREVAEPGSPTQAVQRYRRLEQVAPPQLASDADVMARVLGVLAEPDRVLSTRPATVSRGLDQYFTAARRLSDYAAARCP